MCKHTVKRFPFVIKYILNQYVCINTQEMCDSVVLYNGGTLKFVCDNYKNQIMCNQGVNYFAPAVEFVPHCFIDVATYPFTIQFVFKCYKAKDMCNEDVNTGIFVFDFAPDQYKAQEICNKII